MEPTFLALTAEQAERACGVLRLGPTARELIRMGCVEQKTLDEIAEALDLTAEQVIGLRDDLARDVERAAQEAPEEENLARLLLSFFRGQGGRDHGPATAVNRFSGLAEEVVVRSPILNESDLGAHPDDWRTEPVDVLGRAPGQAGRWRQKAPGRRR
jgi:hypothetical protein